MTIFIKGHEFDVRRLKFIENDVNISEKEVKDALFDELNKVQKRKNSFDVVWKWSLVTVIFHFIGIGLLMSPVLGIWLGYALIKNNRRKMSAVVILFNWITAGILGLVVSSRAKNSASIDEDILNYAIWDVHYGYEELAI